MKPNELLNLKAQELVDAFEALNPTERCLLQVDVAILSRGGDVSAGNLGSFALLRKGKVRGPVLPSSRLLDHSARAAVLAVQKESLPGPDL